MSDHENLFGPNLPVGDHARMVSALGIREGERVLEVGGAANPFPRADAVCDLTFGSSAQRNGAPAVLREDVTYVEAPAESLPFEDGAFDFVYCTQVLEHVADPVAAAAELGRVARRGFVEVPSRLGEMLSGNPTHRWVVDRRGGALVFTPRNWVEHPLRNFFYGLILKDRELQDLAEHGCRNLFNHQVLFEGALEVRRAPCRGTAFDYGDPLQAGRAHYSFARNILAAGAPADYAFPDALEAVRLLPGSGAARRLLACYHGRLLDATAGLEVLEGLSDLQSRCLRSLLERLRRGEPLDVASLPLPDDDPLAPDLPAAETARPPVSVVVFGDDPELLRRSCESVLTQDYPSVEAVVAAACSKERLEASFSNLHMEGRLVLLPCGAGTSPGALLNRGALKAGGEILGFLVAGERLLPHHADRLVSHLLGRGARAVHTDRLLVTGEGVVGPDVVPGNPASAAASLSCLLLHRKDLVETGAFVESAGSESPLEMLLRLARSGKLEHLREVTVEGRGPLPAGGAVMDQTRAALGLDPRELVRSLMAAHAREEGLRARIRELERRLGGSPP